MTIRLIQISLMLLTYHLSARADVFPFLQECAQQNQIQVGFEELLHQSECTKLDELIKNDIDKDHQPALVLRLRKDDEPGFIVITSKAREDGNQVITEEIHILRYRYKNGELSSHKQHEMKNRNGFFSKNLPTDIPFFSIPISVDTRNSNFRVEVDLNGDKIEVGATPGIGEDNSNELTIGGNKIALVNYQDSRKELSIPSGDSYQVINQAM